MKTDFFPIPDIFSLYLNLVTLLRWALYEEFKRKNRIILLLKAIEPI